MAYADIDRSLLEVDMAGMQRALKLDRSEGGTEVAFYSHAATQFERLLAGDQG